MKFAQASALSASVEREQVSATGDTIQHWAEPTVANEGSVCESIALLEGSRVSRQGLERISMPGSKPLYDRRQEPL